MSWTTFGRDGGTSFYWNCKIHIVKLLSTRLTESYPLEMWLLLMMKTSREKNGTLEGLKLLSQDLMVMSEERLFESKLRQEDSLNSDVQHNTFTPYKSVAGMMSQKQQLLSRRVEPDPIVSSVRPEQHPELRGDRPRRVAAVEADRRRKTWLENLN